MISLRRKKQAKLEKQQQVKTDQEIFSTPKHKDIAPSMVREVVPGEMTATGKATDYWVEVGTTSGITRYFRSFYAALQGTTTWFGMLNPLYTGDIGQGDLDTMVHVKPVDSSKTLYEITRRLAGLESDLMTEKNPNKAESLRQAILDLKEQQHRLRLNEEKLYRVAIMATASSEDISTLKKICNTVVKRFAGQNIHLRAADNWHLDALIGTLPIGKNPLKHTYKNMETSCVADLFPFGNGTISHKEGVWLGYDNMGKPVFFDNWHPRLSNYNGVVFGRAGSGKSFFVKAITSRSVAQGIRTAILDPEREYQMLMEYLGGAYIVLSADSKDRINIFDVEADPVDGIVDIEEAVRSALPVIYRMIRTVDKNVLTGQVKILLQEKILELYESFGITDDPNSLYTKESADGKIHLQGMKKKMPTLSDFHSLIEQDERLAVVADIIKMFTIKGGIKSQAVFDGESTVDLKNAPVFAISIADLDEEIMKPLGSFVATKFIWEKFVKQNPKIRKRVAVDEAQVFMDEPESARWLENAFRRARKRNCGFWAITQGFEVFTRVPEGMGILKNSPMVCLFRQESQDIDAVQGKFDLSAGEAQFVLTSDTGSGIIKVDKESSILHVRAFPEEAEVYNTDPNRGVANAS
jgi:conjugal transfer ATP-binding protein TraC